MRELKYKIWDTGCKKWFTNDFCISQDGKRIHWKNGSMLIEEDNFIICQFTGLFDKKLNPIFDGDVLQWMSSKGFIYDPDYPKLYLTKGIVQYNENDLGWEVKVFEKDNQSTDHVIHPNKEIDDMNFEIIGDIFTTPELLENKKELQSCRVCGGNPFIKIMMAESGHPDGMKCKDNCAEPKFIRLEGIEEWSKEIKVIIDAK